MMLLRGQWRILNVSYLEWSAVIPLSFQPILISETPETVHVSGSNGYVKFPKLTTTESLLFNFRVCHTVERDSYLNHNGELLDNYSSWPIHNANSHGPKIDIDIQYMLSYVLFTCFAGSREEVLIEATEVAIPSLFSNTGAFQQAVCSITKTSSQDMWAESATVLIIICRCNRKSSFKTMQLPRNSSQPRPTEKSQTHKLAPTCQIVDVNGKQNYHQRGHNFPLRNYHL